MPDEDIRRIPSTYQLGDSLSTSFICNSSKTLASAGNRTRAARVAGEHSTTEPPMRTLAQGSNVE